MIDEEPVTLPPRFATRLPLTVACVSMIESEPIPPSEPAVACASAVACCGPMSSASTRTAPVLPSVAPELDVRAHVAGHVAWAKAPVRPTTQTPITSTVAFAWFDAWAWTVIDDELVKEPSTSAIVSPLTSGDRDEDVDRDAAGRAARRGCLGLVRRGRRDEDGAGRGDVPRRR